MPLSSAWLALGLASTPAYAQETLDVGVIRESDIAVVQKNLYPKAGRSEISASLGVMPFDAWLTTPNLQVGIDKHLSETLGVSVALGGGYGFKTAPYKELESPAFGAAPYAFRYLGSGLVGVEWSPIYAKMAWNGAKVIHFDVYGVGRGGLSVESSVIPGGGLAFAPTVSPGVGTRFFLGERTAVRFEVRDDLLLEYRDITANFAFKQNANVGLGLAFLSPVQKERK